MFSSRLPGSLSTNKLSISLERLRASGRPILDLTESNPTKAGFGYPLDLLAPLAHARGLVYDPHPLGLPAARQAIAGDFRRRGVDVPAERVALTASTSEAYSVLFKLLADPGDEVLVPRPSYPLFDHLTQLDALVARPYDLEYHGAWTIDCASVEGAMTARTRVLLIVHPNNPTGSFVKHGELDRLAELCADRGVAIVADEVFADYELEPGAARHAARVLDRRDVLVFSLGGLSKSAGLPQVKLGWIAVAGPDVLIDRTLERLELVCDTYLSVATPVQAAAAELLEGGADIRGQIQARVSGNYQRLKAATSGASVCRALEAEGGWYAVLQVPTLGSEEDLVLHLLEKDNVLTHPGYFFDFPSESYLVVSLLTPQPTFEDALGRLTRHFDCSLGERPNGE
jgi:aspartate/methionine/tyrosine aminotransferase